MVIVSEYTAINGTWLPIETATATTMAGTEVGLASPPLETVVSTSIVGDVGTGASPLGSQGSSSVVGIGIGGYIWSGLGGAVAVGDVMTSTMGLPTSVSSNGSGLVFGDASVLLSPLGGSGLGGAVVTTTGTSGPMLAAATGGATVVRLRFWEGLALGGVVFGGMVLL